MPSRNSTLRHMIWLLSGLTLLFIVVWQAPSFYTVQGLASYLPLHMFAETFSIVVSMMVFGVAWNVYSTERPGNIVILACALLAVGLIDFAHMLSFKGMPDFITPSGPEKAINLWLSARLIAALALLTVAMRSWQRSYSFRARHGLLAISLAVAAVVIWLGLVYPQAWPRTFIAGQGLTPFKIGAEYAIVAVLLIPAVLFYVQARRPQSYDATGLFAATVITILSELSFTVYSDVADIFNLLGHVYKIVAYMFIYRAVFVSSVREPFQRLDTELAENQRISKELRTASLYTRSLIEASLDPLVTISPEGKITDVNHATEIATGRSRAELVGTDFSDCFAEPDKARRGYQEAFLKGFVSDYPLVLRHRDGRFAQMLYNASVYQNEKGEVLGVLASARDITEHRRAELARSQLAAIVESSSDAIIGKTPDGIITSWNKGAEKIYGYSAAEVVGRHITMLAPAALHAEIDGLLEKVRNGGAIENHETERVRKDGTTISVALTLSPIHDASGKVGGVSTIARDITERKRAEQQIRQSETKYRTLIQNIQAAVVVHGADTQILVSNSMAQEILGLSEDQLSGKMAVDPAWHFFREDGKAAPLDEYPVNRVLATRQPLRNLVLGVHRPGLENDVWALVNADPVLGQGGEIAQVIITFIDITERKQVEESLKRMNERFSLASRAANLGVWDWNLQKNELVWDDRMYELYGVRREDFAGAYEAWLQGIHPDDRALSDEISKQAQRGEREYDTEFRVVWPDGSIHYLKAYGRFVRDAEGNPLRMTGVNFDITQLKLAEEELRTNERRFRMAQAIGHVGNWEYNVKTTQFWGSDEAKRIYGFDPARSDFSTEEVEKCITERERVHRALVELIERNQPYDLEFEIFPRGSSVPKIISSIADVKRDENGNPEVVMGVIQDITGRRLAQQALRRSEHGLAEAQRIAHLGNWELDLVKNELIWSDEIFRIFEIDPDKFGASYEAFLNAIHPEDRDMVNKAYTDSVNNKVPYDIVHRLQMPDGRIKYVNEKCETYYGVDGKPSHSFGTVHDITDRILDQQALLRLNRELRAISNCNETLMRAENEQSLLDEICRIICEDAGYRMAWVGCPENDEAKTIRPVAWAGVEDGYLAQAGITWADTERGRGPTGTAMRSGKSVGFQDFGSDLNAAPWRAAALQRGYRSSIAVPLKGESANSLGVLTIYSSEPNAFTPEEIHLLEELAEDMAFGIRVLRTRVERQQAAAALTQSEYMYRTLAENSPDVIVRYDREGRRIYVNPQFERVNHLTAQQVIGKTPAEFSTELKPGVEVFTEKLMAAMATGSPTTIDLSWDKNGRTICWFVRVVPESDENGNVVSALTIWSDITERKQAEEEIKSLNRELEQRVAARTADLEAANQELESFSYSVSHDLRTPLRAIDGFSHILLDDYADKLDEEGRRLLNVVRNNTDRMGQLIDDILKFSRAGRLEINFSEIDMEKLAYSVFVELRPVVAGDKLQMEIEHIPPARGDGAMMRQVFVNLLSNAIKFSATREVPRIHVGATVKDGENIYFVKDNGAGFDMQFSDKLFGVFQRLHGVTEFEGTGIGLAIVKRIIARHGGRVWAEGKVNAGATFYFSVPISTQRNS